MNDPAKATPADPKPDFGDELTPEQIAAGEAEPKLTDKEVDDALAAMDPKKGEDPPPAETKETEDPPPEKSKRKDTRIPKSRFDEAVGQERARAEAAEAKLAELEARMQPAQPSQPTQPTIDDAIAEAEGDVLQARQDWQQAILDNDSDKASQLLDSMTRAEGKLQDLRLDKASQATRQVTTEDISFDARLTQLEKEFPQIKEGSDVYSREIDVDLGTLYTGFVNGGMGRVAALNKAAKMLLKPIEPPKKDDKDDAKSETEKTLREKTNKALEQTVEGQPPATEAVGRPSTKEPTLKPSRMTRKQFEKLSEEQLAVLRGDSV